jgi:hypothetical protein
MLKLIDAVMLQLEALFTLRLSDWQISLYRQTDRLMSVNLSKRLTMIQYSGCQTRLS